MFTHQIAIGSGRTLSNILYVAQRTDGNMVMYSPSQRTIRVIAAQEFERTERRNCCLIPGGIVAGAGKGLAELVMEQFRQHVVSTAMYPEEWELK